MLTITSVEPNVITIASLNGPQFMYYYFWRIPLNSVNSLTMVVEVEKLD